MIWHYKNDEIKMELGDAPEAKIASLQPLKNNGIRKVFCVDGLFFKNDTRGGHRLKRECESGRFLASKGIPCIEYLAWGQGADGEWLISRALEGAFQFDRYLETLNPLDEKSLRLYEKFAEFVRQIMEAGVFHPDFHTGNVLYIPEKETFALVDVYGVRKWHFWDALRRRKMRDIFNGIPWAVPKAFFLKLLALSGEKQPEIYFRKEVERRYKWLVHDWPKRKSQILKGYYKFAHLKGNTLVRRGVEFTEDVRESCVKVSLSAEDAQKRFLVPFYLNLCGIVCQRALAWNRDTNDVFFEKCTDFNGTIDAAWLDVLPHLSIGNAKNVINPQGVPVFDTMNYEIPICNI